MERHGSLYNDDIAPSETRNWGVFSLMSVWFTILHNIGVYTAAAGLLLIGMPAWQAGCAIMLALVFAQVFAQIIGNIGYRHGVPFPVLARASFGVFGSNLPALIRAVVAVAWYGIQTYLASRAVIVLLLSISPQLTDLDSGGFLGLSTIGWIAFLGLWALQLVVMTHGIETIRRFQNYAGAAISVVMIALAMMLYVQVDGQINWSYGDQGLAAKDNFLVFCGAVAIFFAIFSTLLLNFCDFTRFAPKQSDVFWGNFFGLIVNGIVFCLVVIVITSGAEHVYGRVIIDPTDILAATNNRVIMGLGAVLFIFATIGVNVIANAVSPAYDFASALPKYISFTRGAVLTAVLSVFVMPWKMYSSTVAINYFLGSIGALLGPIFGVMIADYIFVRRGQIDTDALYSANPHGQYFYSGGWNAAALQAMIPASIVSVSMVLLPALSAVAPYAWFVGSSLGAGIYLFINRKGMDRGSNPIGLKSAPADLG
ncbi:hypothetical protein ASD00_32105 [Ensifer sp. Root31]|uniref:NCS1 family nucleobase:cation symporter-1 n=1 Tax=Ensifer sp. Root31 TaxID=1736512 RepID=UPI00070E39C6|nr:NCS1 family nucleobase:cation symporter-1 [Ensifer sp. Root31]KQU85636.1 hypothetical protein ASD00_32105 [Ensifer sp. Root31]